MEHRASVGLAILKAPPARTPSVPENPIERKTGMRALAGWIRVGLCAGCVALSAWADDGPPTLFIKVQRLIRRPGDEIQNAALIVRGGKIVAVGVDLQKPEGAREIDGAVACAAFIDAWAALGVGADSLQDPGTTAATRTVDGIDRWTNDHLRKDALRAGVTVVRVQAGTNARTGGVGALLRVAPGLPPAESVVLADCDVAMSIGLASSAGDPNERADPFERISDLDRVVSAVESGKGYLVARTEHRYELEEWEKKITEKDAELTKDAKKAKKDREKEQKDATDKGKPFQEKKYKEDKRPQPPRYDEDTEVLARVADGAVPLLVQANRASEIRGLLAGTTGFDRLRLVLAGGAESLSCARSLAERQIAVLVARRARAAPDLPVRRHERPREDVRGRRRRGDRAARDRQRARPRQGLHGADAGRGERVRRRRSTRQSRARQGRGDPRARRRPADGRRAGPLRRLERPRGPRATELNPMILLLIPALFPLAFPSTPQGRVLAIRADRVLLGDGQALAPGVILVEDGRISAVGSDLSVPEGASVSVHKGTASAGLIALHSHSGSPGEMRDSTRTILPEARVALSCSRRSRSPCAEARAPS